MRLGGPREDEHPARAAVEPVDHPERAVERLELLAQTPLAARPPRDDEPPRRLVDREEVRVLVQDRDGPAHTIFLAGTTFTGPNRSSEGAIDFAGPVSYTHLTLPTILLV